MMTFIHKHHHIPCTNLMFWGNAFKEIHSMSESSQNNFTIGCPFCPTSLRCMNQTCNTVIQKKTVLPHLEYSSIKLFMYKVSFNIFYASGEFKICNIDNFHTNAKFKMQLMLYNMVLRRDGMIHIPIFCGWKHHIPEQSLEVLRQLKSVCTAYQNLSGL